MARQEPNPKTLIDNYTSTSYVYTCWTYDLSALTSQPKWIIKRLELSTGKTLYADGNDQPDNIADNRVSLTYS